MAITFAQQKRRQQYLIIVLACIVVLTLFIVWRGFLMVPAAPASPQEPVKPPEVKIDFSILQNPILQELEPFPEIQPLPEDEVEKVGRENPFVPPTETKTIEEKEKK